MCPRCNPMGSCCNPMGSRCNPNVLEVLSLVAAVERRYGRLDLLFNNAGVRLVWIGVVHSGTWA